MLEVVILGRGEVDDCVFLNPRGECIIFLKFYKENEGNLCSHIPFPGLQDITFYIEPAIVY